MLPGCKTIACVWMFCVIASGVRFMGLSSDGEILNYFTKCTSRCIGCQTCGLLSIKQE